MDKLAKVIGERIRSFRREKGWSQEELSNAANLHFTYIGQLERGEKNATLESIQKVANALEVSLGNLFLTIQPNQSTHEYTLSQIITRLQTQPIEDQKIILKLLDLLIEWRKNDTLDNDRA